MDTIIVRASRLKHAGYVAMAAVFVAGGYWLITRAQSDAIERFVGWICVLSFGLCLIVFLRQLIDSRPRLVLNHEGVTDPRLGVGTIPWTAILSAELKFYRGSALVALQMREPEHWTSRLIGIRGLAVRRHKAMGFGDLSLDLSRIHGNPADVFRAIESQLNQPLASDDITNR